jgi:hypothetical protein
MPSLLETDAYLFFAFYQNGAGVAYHCIQPEKKSMFITGSVTNS